MAMSHGCDRRPSSHKTKTRERVSEEEDEWDTDPGFMTHRTEPDMRWRADRNDLADMSIQSFEVYSRGEPLPVPGGIGRDGNVQRFPARSQQQTRYEETQEERDVEEEEEEAVCYVPYDEMEQVPGPAAQSDTFQSHSSDSCSIHTCRSRAPMSSSYQSVEDDLKAMLQVPPQAFRTEDNDTVSQNTTCPEVQHILEHYSTTHKERNYSRTCLDCSSNFKSNATVKLEKFFNRKLKAASHSPDQANSYDNETGLYENVDKAFEDKSAPYCPPAHSSCSVKQKASRCFPVAPNNLARSPSLERIRMMMDRTQHVQHLQAQFEKQIQTSMRQQEWEQRHIVSREKGKQMALNSRVKDKSKAKGKRSGKRRYCREQDIPRAWTTEVQGRRKVWKSEQLELPVDAQYERSNARTGPQEMSGMLQKHMEVCKACNLAEHLGSCSRKWCIDDRHQQKAEKGKRSMKRSKEKDLQVQRWMEKRASEDSRRSRSSNKYTDCHKGLKQACACETCHTLDKKSGRSREAPRKSYQNRRESQEEYGHQHYECPKASRSWISVIPQAERDSQYRENMPKDASCSELDLLDIPEGVCFCSDCKKGQQGSHSLHQHQPRHYRYHPHTTTPMSKGRSRVQLGVPQPVTSLQWLTQKMSATDQVKEITGVFERRAVRDAELIERERLTDLFKMIELNRGRWDEDRRSNQTQRRVREEQQSYKEKPKAHQHVCHRDRRNDNIARLQEGTCYSHNPNQRHRGNCISLTKTNLSIY